MELNELKLITAANLIRLRTGQGLTQAELGAKLNYSDKTISKWERGEAIPDAFVLVQLAEIFGVSVNDLLSSQDRWEPPVDPVAADNARSYSVNVIIAIVLISVFTAALTVFVTLWLLEIIEWRVFLVALSVELLVFLILDCVFKHARHLPYILGAFVLSLFLLVYVFLPLDKPWQLFLLAVPAETLVSLGCKVRRVPRVRDFAPKVRHMVKNRKK